MGLLGHPPYSLACSMPRDNGSMDVVEYPEAVNVATIAGVATRTIMAWARIRNLMKRDADWPSSTLQHQSLNCGLRFWKFSCHAFLQRPNLYHHRSLRVQQPRRGHVDVGAASPAIAKILSVYGKARRFCAAPRTTSRHARHCRP